MAQQQFKYKASLAGIDSSGFYQLKIPLSLLSKCQPGLADLRIKDTEGKEIAYYIDNGQPQEKNALQSFPILFKGVQKDKKMHVQVKSNGEPINQLVLEVQNAYASRTVNINGSNDGKEWFIIKDNVQVNGAGNNSNGSYLFMIDLPVSNAAYYDISFNDKELLPVNILKAGTFTYEVSPIAYDTVQTVALNQKDSSNKKSYLRLLWDASYPIDKIKLSISGPVYYRRSLRYDAKPYQQQTTILASGNDAWLYINSHTATINLQVTNEDNPPLQIESAKALVRKYTLYTWLQKDKSYHLYFGDSLVQQPNYDLVYFKDLARENTGVIKMGSIEKIKLENTAVHSRKSMQPVIWLAMAVALLLLLFFTFKLTGEVNKRQA